MIDTSHIIGHGADADPARRPGIPRETAPRIAEGAVSSPPRQQADVMILQDRADDSMPPVFGTAQPPSGLSGAMRKAAYAYPAHWTRHWMLLLVADRVNVWEHRIGKLASVRGVGALATLAAGGLLATRMLRRRRRERSLREIASGVRSAEDERWARRAMDVYPAEVVPT